MERTEWWNGNEYRFVSVKSELITLAISCRPCPCLRPAVGRPLSRGTPAILPWISCGRRSHSHPAKQQQRTLYGWVEWDHSYLKPKDLYKNLFSWGFDILTTWYLATEFITVTRAFRSDKNKTKHARTHTHTHKAPPSWNYPLWSQSQFFFFFCLKPSKIFKIVLFLFLSFCVWNKANN